MGTGFILRDATSFDAIVTTIHAFHRQHLKCAALNDNYIENDSVQFGAAIPSNVGQFFIR